MILCLDIAWDNIGWSIIDHEIILKVGLISPLKSKKKNIYTSELRADRCGLMAGEFTDILMKYKIEGVLGELPSGSQNARAANLLGWASGMVVSVLRTLEIPAEWVGQNDVKKAVVGKLNATKEEIMDRVAKHYGWRIERDELKVIKITKGKRAGKTVIQKRVTYHVLGEKFPAGKFEHIADSIGVYWASKGRNLVRLFG